MRKLDRILIFLIFVIALSFFVFISPKIVLFPTRHYADTDFFSFWLASKMTWSNQDPFDETLWLTGHDNYGASWVSDDTFLYPPGLAILLAPIGLLPLYEAYVVWVFLSLIFVLTSLIIMFSVWNDNLTLSPYFIPALAGALLFRPLIATLIHGQIDTLILLMIALAVLFMHKGKSTASGVMLGLLLLKPNIGFLINAVVGFYGLVKKRWRLIGGVISGITIIFILSQIRSAGWINQYLFILANKGKQALGLSPTMWGLIGLACDTNSSCIRLYGLVLSGLFLLMVFIFLSINKDEVDPLIVISIAISSMLLITPYLWGYDQILLLIPIVMITMAFQNRGYPYLLTASLPLCFSLLAALFAYVGLHLNLDAASTLLSLVCFAVVIWLSIQGPGQK